MKFFQSLLCYQVSYFLKLFNWVGCYMIWKFVGSKSNYFFLRIINKSWFVGWKTNWNDQFSVKIKFFPSVLLCNLYRVVFCSENFKVFMLNCWKSATVCSTTFQKFWGKQIFFPYGRNFSLKKDKIFSYLLLIELQLFIFSTAEENFLKIINNFFNICL